MRWLLADWGSNKRHIFDAVAEGLRRLGHQVTSIPRNVMRRRPSLIGAILSGDFDVLLTWQRFYPMQREIVEAIGEAGIRTVFADFGFVPHYETVVLDTDGENASSSWPAMWQSGEIPPLDGEFVTAAERLIEMAALKAALAPCPLGEEASANVRMPFVFVPLQRPGDSVVRYDSNVRDFGSLCRRVLFLARSRYFVVIKTHPLDASLDLGVPDHVRHSHLILRSGFGADNERACDWLLANSSLVVGINSNMLFRAIVFGTPVVATGRGWYSGSGALTEVSGLDGLSGLWAGVPDRVAQIRYVAMCLSRQLLFSELSSPDKLGAMLGRLGLVESPLEPTR